MVAHWGFAVMAMLLIPWNSAQAHPEDPGLWISRLEKRVVNAEKLGLLSEDKREELYDGIRKVKRMRNEALLDGVVTVRELAAIRSAVGEVSMDIAEARFGPREEVVAVSVLEQRRRVKEPSDAPGTVTVAPAL